MRIYSLDSHFRVRQTSAQIATPLGYAVMQRHFQQMRNHNFLLNYDPETRKCTRDSSAGVLYHHCITSKRKRRKEILPTLFLTWNSAHLPLSACSSPLVFLFISYSQRPHIAAVECRPKTSLICTASGNSLYKSGLR